MQIRNLPLWICLLLLTLAPVTQAADPQFKWKMVTTWPPYFPVYQVGLENLARDIEKMSDGRLKIEVLGGGELVPALKTFDAVAEGIAQMGYGTSYYWADKIPAAQIMSAVPFGMTTKGMNA